MFTTGINHPPETPVINGPASGMASKVYSYTFVSEDPDGDDLYYWLDWGDGNYSGWLGPVLSGDMISLSHGWNEKGTYNVKIKAKDIYDDISNWSEPIIVHIIDDSDLKNSLMFGLINNSNDDEDFTTFSANIVLSINLNTFDFKIYNSNEQIVISNDYLGYIEERFLFGCFNAAVISG